MRQPPEFFDDKDIVLVHIGTTLRSALKLEDALTKSGIDYAVETDQYQGGLLFWTKRTGVFFYVVAGDVPRAHEVMRSHRFRIHHE